MYHHYDNIYKCFRHTEIDFYLLHIYIWAQKPTATLL